MNFDVSDEEAPDALATSAARSCTRWPCSSDAERATLIVNDKGFLVCPLCGGSYGRPEPALEVYDALCLQDPWLELILSGHKTLETRTKCLRKKSGPVVLASSQTLDMSPLANQAAHVLDAAARQRAVAGRGKLRALVVMGGFRPGEPGVDDRAACIPIRLPSGKIRFVSPVSEAKRIKEVPSVRVQEKGGKVTVVKGAAQGFYRVPKEKVVLL